MTSEELARKIYADWFRGPYVSEAQVMAYIRLRLSTAKGRAKLIEDIRIEKEIRQDRIDRQIEGLKLSPAELRKEQRELDEYQRTIEIWIEETP